MRDSLNDVRPIAVRLLESVVDAVTAPRPRT